MLDIDGIANRRKLDYFIEDNGIDKESICLAGSTCLAVRGLRRNNDIDVIASDDVIKQIGSLTSTNQENQPYQVVNNNKNSNVEFDITFNRGRKLIGFDATRYDRFDFIDISDKDVLTNPQYHDTVGGYKIVRPEISASFRQLRRSSGDERDSELLLEYCTQNDDWDWELVFYDEYQRKMSKSRQSKQGTSKIRLVKKGIESLTRDGPISTIKKISERYIDEDSRKQFGQLRENITKRTQNTQLMHAGELWINQSNTNSFVSYDIPVMRAIRNGGLPQDVGSSLEDRSSQTFLNGDGSSRKVVVVDKELHILTPDPFLDYLNAGIVEIPTVQKTDQYKTPNNKKWLGNLDLNQKQLDKVETVRNSIADSSGAVGYAILWGVAHEYWDEIQSDIEARHNVIETFDIQLGEKLPSFLDHQFIPRHAKKKFHLEYKKYKFSSFPQRIRVVKFRLDEFESQEQMHSSIKSMKHELRLKYHDAIDDHYYHSILHISDDLEEHLLDSKLVKQYKGRDQNKNTPL